MGKITQIPFLPVEFFKTQHVYAAQSSPEIVFTSSGTTGLQTSKHPVADVQLYEQSFIRSFERFFGKINNYCILALLPAYLERQGSSLIYMVEKLIRLSSHPKSGFYLYNHNDLIQTLQMLEAQQTPVILFGVSFALLDLAEKFPRNFKLKHTTVIENLSLINISEPTRLLSTSYAVFWLKKQNNTYYTRDFTIYTPTSLHDTI